MKKKSTSYKLINLLADGKFHSGESLGDKLNISRAGVWKSIQKLGEYGIQVDSVPRSGYRILHGMELLTSSAIEDNFTLLTRNALDDLLILTDTTSTNDHLLTFAKKIPATTLACFAEYQSAGRGRRGRQWIAPFGSNIYHSLLWNFDKDPAEIMGLSLAVAVAITRALGKIGVSEGLQLKWPNDVLWQGRKLSGVLIDVLAEPHEHCLVIIGIGINTYIPPTYAPQIDQPWVDLYKITDKPVERNRLASILLNELVAMLTEFNREGLTPFVEEWESFNVMQGKSVTLHTPQGKIEGVMQGISPQGALRLFTKENQSQEFMSGELSLRMK